MCAKWPNDTGKYTGLVKIGPGPRAVFRCVSTIRCLFGSVWASALGGGPAGAGRSCVGWGDKYGGICQAAVYTTHRWGMEGADFTLMGYSTIKGP